MSAQSRRSCRSSGSRRAVAARRQGAGLQVPALAQQRHDAVGALLGGLAHGVEDQVGVLGLLVGVVHAGEVVELAANRLRIEALVGARGARLDRGAAPDLEERLYLLARPFAALAVRRD